MLVIQPIGGKDDWEALFHEAGHTEHFANTSADAARSRRGASGDPAVSEGWAALLERLVTEPAWLNRRLDVPRPADLAHEGADVACSSRAAMPRSSCTRSSSSRPTTPRR